ncbi:hypothetical protein SAPIO_CDS2436 [Scedosporium apiospermum]|uniref:AMP-dependent synthetase/ligase domain-containing protein n=1 Tax=Pseudallescheria apiosperma TaxID=563466 RepID=A0A084GCH3_PSEDA|nr:uncharacterized protein SAPIO_CDS2436 [Scedosporium apiospermum]KEZ45035.1 hypothetical protein SAPIO_CDS2436 [Scedosporium apiospermum]
MSTRATPSEYASWLAHGSGSLVKALNWKFAWAGREVLPPSLAQTLRELELPELKLYNSYGPAETITCTKAEVRLAENNSASSDDGNPNDADDSRNDSHSSEAAVIPAGFLLPGDSVFIVDHNLDLLPQGAAGQIVIDGPSVAAGRVVYRTGDVGRLQSDGSLVFIGRVAGDIMIKMRGMRVDLQETEMPPSQRLRTRFVRLWCLWESHLLVAHAQFVRNDFYPGGATQKAFLRQLRFILSLPLYLVPALFVPFEQMPTDAHGKTDRNASNLTLPRVASDVAELKKCSHSLGGIVSLIDLAAKIETSAVAASDVVDWEEKTHLQKEYFEDLLTHTNNLLHPYHQAILNTNPVTDDEKKTDSKVAEEELIEIRLDSGDLLETHLGLSDLSFSSPWT